MSTKIAAGTGQVGSWRFQCFLLPGFVCKALVAGGCYVRGRELTEFHLPGPKWVRLGSMPQTVPEWSVICATTSVLSQAKDVLDGGNGCKKFARRDALGCVFLAMYILPLFRLRQFRSRLIYNGVAGSTHRVISDIMTLKQTFHLVVCFAAIGLVPGSAFATPSQESEPNNGAIRIQAGTSIMSTKADENWKASACHYQDHMFTAARSQKWRN